jgi:predicted O-linked N-acetylglucosamine transferase (SPINDLY family)
MATTSEALAIAIRHHQGGRLQAAEQIYRQILAAEPEHADALHLLGVIAHQTGRHAVAVDCIRRAIGLKGDAAVFHLNLGNALKDQGQPDEAVACCRRALELKPDYAEAHNNLGVTFIDILVDLTLHTAHNRLLVFARQPAPVQVTFAGYPCTTGLTTVDYRRIDIGLDTVPYNGHTTSLDAFWVGVPVVTLTGPTVVGRAGSSQLRNLGLPELIASSPEQYVEVAAELARDLPRLGHLRATLRRRMQSSPLMDAPQFARNIEAAYRAMWRRWCAR